MLNKEADRTLSQSSLWYIFPDNQHQSSKVVSTSVSFSYPQRKPVSNVRIFRLYIHVQVLYLHLSHPLREPVFKPQNFQVYNMNAYIEEWERKCSNCYWMKNQIEHFHIHPSTYNIIIPRGRHFNILGNFGPVLTKLLF